MILGFGLYQLLVKLDCGCRLVVGVGLESARGRQEVRGEGGGEVGNDRNTHVAFPFEGEC